MIEADFIDPVNAMFINETFSDGVKIHIEAILANQTLEEYLTNKINLWYDAYPLIFVQRFHFSMVVIFMIFVCRYCCSTHKSILFDCQYYCTKHK